MSRGGQAGKSPVGNYIHILAGQGSSSRETGIGMYMDLICPSLSP